uniref:Uncharacterized protein n=1 Tax=Parascaris equorum TaxID=6256 RepID=A0A914R7D3_PAREQ
PSVFHVQVSFPPSDDYVAADKCPQSWHPLQQARNDSFSSKRPSASVRSFALMATQHRSLL